MADGDRALPWEPQMADRTLSRVERQEFQMGDEQRRASRQVEEVLAELVQQIAIGRYRDPLGHSAVLNTAFLRAQALVNLQNVLEQRGRQEG
jgi:hypothetical protein